MSTEAELLQTAAHLHQAGQLSQAEQIYRQILHTHPWQSDALHLLGLVALQRGRPKSAIEYLSAALVPQPAHPNYYNSLGSALRAIGRLSEAQICFERAVGLSPDHALAHDNLARVLRSQNKPEESLAGLQATLAREPDCVEALSQLGVALASLERFDEGIELLEKAVRLDEQSAQAFSNLGGAYAASKNWDRAAQCFREALRRNPELVDASCRLASVLRHQGKTDAAAATLEETIHLHPNHVETLLNYASLLESQGRAAESLEWAQRALRMEPGSARARFERAKALLGLKRSDEARREFREAIRYVRINSQTQPNLMMFCLNASHERKCLFVHVPKNGGTSIKRALDMPAGGHLPWTEYAAHFPWIWRNYTSFAVVRNPWDRFVSAYHHSRMESTPWHNEQTGKLHPDYLLLRDKSLAECALMLWREPDRLKHEAWQPQSLFVVDSESPDKRIVVDALLRFEHLAEDFSEFCRKLGIQQANLPKVNPSVRSHDYRAYYDEQTRRIIEQVYQVDIQRFGYSF